jgi:Chaperone of endosialidase
MPEGYSGLPPFYVESSDPITPNLGLSLAGADPLVAENFYLIDTAFGTISATVDVNGVAVPAPANFVNSASVTFSVVGSNISLTATGGGGGAVSSVSNADGTLTISPTTGAVIASLALGHANTWTGLQTFGTISPTTISGNPNFSGTPTFANPVALGSSTATTQSPGTNNTEIATTAFVEAAISGFGEGTVTSFSAGTLSPLFTTSVATATTTPALSFSLSNAAGGTVFGNPTGSAAAPVYTAVPVLGVNASVAGTLGLATSVASGATITLTNPGALTAYNFELPLTVGAAGSVLTSQAGSAMTWTTQAALGVAWSSLTNATANLTLANAGFTTTFNQTSAVSWLWGNTTVATSGTTNASPLHEFAANYWTGSASAQDLWTLGSSLAAGTNGVSTITFTHTGSTGTAEVSVPSLIIPGTSSGNTVFSTGALGGLSVVSTGLVNITSASTMGLTAPTGASVLSGGLILGVPTGGNEGVGTINAATGYYANGTAGVSAGSFSAITAITTVGGIVTQLTGTSDVRLKDSVPYEGGLNEILAITPARYRWNKKGQAHTGLSGDKAYVGFIAQDVQKAIPEAITATEGVEHYLSFDDRPVIAALVNAVKELAAKVRELESKKEGKYL